MRWSRRDKKPRLARPGGGSCAASRKANGPPMPGAASTAAVAEFLLPAKARPVLSFIVPAHNEAELLGRTLRALHESAATVGEAYEIIVVDDASTDDTSSIAA